MTLTVYYCGKRDSDYTTDHLDKRVDELNAVGLFFQRQSRFKEKMIFERGEKDGGILSPPGIDQYKTISQWGKYRVDRDCLRATGEPNNKQVLILANADGGGYAVLGDYRRSPGGPAVVATQEKRGNRTKYLGTVAHEIGHGFYGLQHPWRDYPVLCDEIDHDVLSDKDKGFCQKSQASEALEQREIGHMLESLLSYIRFGSKRDLTPNEAYVACYQRAKNHLKWTDPDECDEYRASTPATPLSPRLIPEVRAFSVSWSAPDANGADIDDYDVHFRPSDSVDWIDWPHDGTSRQARITGLALGITYQVRVQAWNRIGPSGWSAYVEAMPLPPEDLPRRVILTRGDRVQGEPDCTSDACRWLHVEIENFPPGEHTLACAHNGVHQIRVSRGRLPLGADGCIQR